MEKDIEIKFGLDDNGNTIIKATKIIRLEIDAEAIHELNKRAVSNQNMLEIISVSRLSGDEIRRMVSGYLKDLKDVDNG